MTDSICSFATPRPGGYRTFRLRDGKKTIWRKLTKRYGFCVHVSGADLFKSKDPDEAGLQIYGRDRANLGHYLILRRIDPRTGDAEIVQMVEDDRMCAHAGVDVWQFQAYRDGSWRAPKISDTAMRIYEAAKKKDPTLRLWPNPSSVALAIWDAHWKPFGFQHPDQIGPGISNNEDYAAVELVSDESHPVTEAQYRALRRLLANFASRWGIGTKLWSDPGRLVCHSDLDAYERWTKKGPWDVSPKFRWELVGPPDGAELGKRVIDTLRFW